MCSVRGVQLRVSAHTADSLSEESHEILRCAQAGSESKQLPGSGMTTEHCSQTYGARVAAIGQSFGPGSVALPQLPGV